MGWLSLGRLAFSIIAGLLDWRKERAIKQAERDKISAAQLQEVRRNTARAKSALAGLLDPDRRQRLREKAARGRQ